ncbi:hypothetical protein [Pseudomonas japonica]|uniref:hypothetical protein n=1 Tax=Pseudomonas japonica TaxID=256466 RepID=UPI0015E316FC|nr:hypothetical protein [Pseudomonas japonica]MBA1242310.1 hypothetical protein [Pseudomonas japonica]
MTIPNQSPTPKGADRAQDHLHNLSEEASSAVGDLKEQGTQKYEQYRDLAADQIEGLVEGAQSAASAMEGHDTLGLSQGLADVATSLGEFAERMRNKSAEELLQEGARVARENPVLFLAGTVAVGFALSRFLRASAPAPTASDSDDGLGAMAPTPAEAYGASDPYETSQPVQSAVPPARSTAIDPLPAADPLGEAATYPTLDKPVDPLNKGGLV